MSRQRIIFASCLLLTLLIGYYDHASGAQVSMMLIYALPILISAWYCGVLYGFLIAATASLCWITVNLLGNHSLTSMSIFSWNALTRLGIFVLIAYTVSLQAQLKRSLLREQIRANTDRLTGLLNKSAFRERVELEIKRAQRYQHPLTLAFIDLDNFKQVNDLHGHARGDALLQHVGSTLLATIRKTDCAARIGGDEFALCYPELGEDEVRKAIEKLVLALQIMTSQSGWQVTASVGVVTCTTLSENYDSILGKADQLMYQAKQRGKNSAEFLVI